MFEYNKTKKIQLCEKPKNMCLKIGLPQILGILFYFFKYKSRVHSKFGIKKFYYIPEA